MKIDISKINVVKPEHLTIPLPHIKVFGNVNIFDTELLDLVYAAQQCIIECEQALRKELTLKETAEVYSKIMYSVRPLMVYCGDKKTNSSDVSDYISFFERLVVSYRAVALKYISDSAYSEIMSLKERSRNI